MRNKTSVVLSIAILNFSFAPAFAQRVGIIPKGGLAPIQGRGPAPVNRLVNGTVRYSPSSLLTGKTLIPQGAPSVTTLPGETAVSLPSVVVTPSLELAQPEAAGQAQETLNSVVPQSVDEGAAAVVESATEEAPQAAQPGLITRLARAVTSRLSSGKMFDFSRPGASGLGILPHRPITLPNGVELDQPPAAPTSEQDSGISINSFGFPVERPGGAVMDEAPATVLQANPADEADVERALRSYIDENRSKYGIPSSDLKTIHVKRVNNEGKVPGVNQAETIYAYFHQQRNGLSVHSSFASFTIKILRGRPVLLAAQARLYPAIAAQTVPQYSDEDLLTRAQRRLEEIGAPPQIAELLEYFQQKIIYTAGSWRTASIFVLPGFPVMIAVDVVTGDAFIWDSRVGAEDARSLAGKLAGRGETSDSRPDGKAAISQQPLAHVSVTLEGGKKAVTDRNGRFTTSASGNEAKFTATLSGKYATVNDQSGKPLKVSASLKPGTETEVVYNPEGASEIEVSQVNGYIGATRVHDYLKDHGIDDARIDKAIPVNVNIDDECNAYYTPGRPSLNFFKSSTNCSDTARPGIIAHEYGHFVDDMIGGIVNGGLSEGWGDIFSMFMLRSPIVGDGFLKTQTPSYIRHGENNYQYQQQDEVHDQGQAWMGFGWKLHKSLVAAMNEAGAALAETLVLPTLFAKAADIPTAIAQVLLNDMDANGNMPHEEFIRAAAKAHGIEIPKTRIAALTQAAQQAAGALGFRAFTAADPSKTSIRIVADAEIEKHLEEATHLSSAWMSNRFIEAYYGKNKERLSPAQVKKLLAGLVRNDSSTYGRADTYYRIADAYFAQTAGRMAVADAVALAGGTAYPWQTNYLIEKHFQLAKSLLSWDDVKMLLAGLIRNDSSTYGRADTQNRIILAWEEISHQQAAGILTASGGMNFRPAAPGRFLVTYRGNRALRPQEFGAMRRSLEKAGIGVLDRWGNTFLVEGYAPVIKGVVSAKKRGWTVSPERISKTAKAERWTPAGKGIGYSRAIPVEQRALLTGALHSNQAQWAALMESGGYDIVSMSLMVKSAVVTTSGRPNVVKTVKYSADVSDGKKSRAVIIRVGMGALRDVEFSFVTP